MHNEHRITPELATRMEGGETMALISDAGTPGISDPGFLLVRECLRKGVSVECLPGATALIPALVESGFPTDRFVFEGVLPPKKGRQKRLQALREEQRTLVFYESPHKLLKTLEQFLEVFGPDREVSVSRELSKLYGETIRGTLQTVADHFRDHPPRGEFVLVVKGAGSGA
jgi:16S rRNA (cytidine1402-2'-O)-methyltransferase